VTGVGFHPAARAELLTSVSYYDEQADGLGRQFTDEVERAVDLLSEQPGLGAPIIGTEKLRRWSLRRFPHYLIYRAEPNTLLILAVAHQRRRPGYWKERA
jgi:plasmid stabilization system protein ParE